MTAKPNQSEVDAGTSRGHSLRLQKFLAQQGIASRRKCEQIITDGRVTVNGDIVSTLGTSVDPTKDKVQLDGNPVDSSPPAACNLALYKPRGYLCSASSAHGRTVCDLVSSIDARLVPAGRLDKDSEGLVLMSNDGELINCITHPKFGHSKSYAVTVSGHITPFVIERLNSRMTIDDYLIQKVSVSISKQSTTPGRTILEFTLTEGRNRQIRKMCERVNLLIHRLVRTSVGQITIRGLAPGKWRDLTAKEISSLYTHPSTPPSTCQS